MATKAERTMQVAPGELTNREDVAPAVAPVTPDAATELRQLRARLDEARRLEPTLAETHCRDCFHRGRNAVIRFLEG